MRAEPPKQVFKSLQEMAFNSDSPDETGVQGVTESPHLNYKMNHRNRGKALIFNNKMFDKAGLTYRDGTDQDATELNISLTKLGFDVSCLRNKSALQMTAAMQNGQ